MVSLKKIQEIDICSVMLYREIKAEFPDELYIFQAMY